jgi:phosphatidylserine/phosphatidylglycerophosphate/cardiolipin synthase-like enzyme
MGVRIASGASFLRAIKTARSIELTASLLTRGKGGVVAALEAAAQRGARVRVRLESDPYDPEGSGGRERANAAIVSELRVYGIDAALVKSAPGAPLHLKAAIADGRLFLDDRNWPADGRDVIAATRDSADVIAVRAAMRGDRAEPAHIAVRKREALAMEADTIARAEGGEIDVQSESFGCGVIARALLERAKAGEPVRLLVSSRDIQGAREARLLASLRAAGAQVRVASGGHDQKLCVAGDRAWLGSANATAGFPDTIDWGARTRAPSAVKALRARFERTWQAARPYAGRAL